MMIFIIGKMWMKVLDPVFTISVWSLVLSGRLETKATEAKNAGVLVMMVDAAAVSNNAESIASNEKLSYVTDKFDVLPFNLVLQRSLCTGKANLLQVNKIMYLG